VTNRDRLAIVDVEGPPRWLKDGTGRRLTGVGELVLDRSVVHR